MAIAISPFSGLQAVINQNPVTGEIPTVNCALGKDLDILEPAKNSGCLKKLPILHAAESPAWGCSKIDKENGENITCQRAVKH